MPAILRKVAEVLADGLSIGVIRQQITYKLKARNRRNHEFGNAEVRKTSGIMLGRCSAITPNEPAFGMNEEEITRYWCERSGIPWLGRADIGHDANNKIVPFGEA